YKTSTHLFSVSMGGGWPPSHNLETSAKFLRYEKSRSGGGFAMVGAGIFIHARPVSLCFPQSKETDMLLIPQSI
ncbi:hypothetical protein, partial [Enterobacter asburiae]|uniref:hypothetical protein n=1 Tax=Enterobacter asburiae TaxID=61645 RepID=UPI001CA32BAE